MREMKPQTTMTFDEIKSELLALAKAPAQDGRCKEYLRATLAHNMEELSLCIRDNFFWCCDNNVLTVETMTRWGLRDYGITANENVHNACCLATGSSTVTATGNSTVRAFGSSTVRAFDSSTVTATGSSTVTATGNSTVRAFGSSTVTATGNSTVRAFDSSTVEATGNSTVRAFDSSTVTATGNSYVNSISTTECKVEENAVLRWNGKIITSCGTITFP